MPGTCRCGDGFLHRLIHLLLQLLDWQVAVNMAIQALSQAVQSLLLVVVIKIGQKGKVRVVDHIDLRIVVVIDVRIRSLPRCLGKQLVKSHVFIELCKVRVLAPLKFAALSVIIVLIHGLFLVW